MRQLTIRFHTCFYAGVSKLPMRQLTELFARERFDGFSKLPMRQLTFISRKDIPH